MAEQTSTAAIEARGLGRRFGRHWALAHVDLAIRPGEAVLLAGPNGSGKTTFLRVVAGLHRPTQGSVKVFGEDAVRGRAESRRNLSLISHHAYLYDRMTALETVRTWARLLGRDDAARELRGRLAEVGLENWADVAVGGFSAGMRKRLTLLRARLEDSRLLMLDEPFSALDAEGREIVAGWVRDSHAAGKTVVIASHDLARSAPLCERAVVLRKGQIVWTGAATEAAPYVEGAG